MTKFRFNLRNVVAITICLVVGSAFFACEKNNGNENGNSSDKGVLINGVRWATCNVGAKGTFVTNPEDYGNYYTWEDAKTACPIGWHMPTSNELQSLVNSGYTWTTQNGINGMLFGTAPNRIFMPAAGISSGSYVGSGGCYWSSTESQGLFFDSGYATVYGNNKTLGFSVRCVAK